MYTYSVYFHIFIHCNSKGYMNVKYIFIFLGSQIGTDIYRICVGIMVKDIN